MHNRIKDFLFSIFVVLTFLKDFMDTTALVEESFEHIKENKEIFITSFYSNLFDLAPEVKPLFSNVDKIKQGEKLYNSLLLLVENLKNPELLSDVLSSLGKDHISYGTQLQHYPVVGECLIQTFKSILKENWDKETESAWLETYNVVVNLMTTKN